MIAALTAALLAAAHLASAQVSLDVLYTFPGSGVSFSELSALLQAADGNLFGMQAIDSGNPVRIYRMTPGGTVTILHEFGRRSGAGSKLRQALIQGTDGNFYGTLPANGLGSLGSVFRMTPGGTVTILHEFAGGSADGPIRARPDPGSRREFLWNDRGRRPRRLGHGLPDDPQRRRHRAARVSL